MSALAVMIVLMSRAMVLQTRTKMRTMMQPQLGMTVRSLRTGLTEMLKLKLVEKQLMIGSRIKLMTRMRTRWKKRTDRKMIKLIATVKEVQV